MSFEAMAWAIRQKLPTKEKFTLLMLANYASNEKGDCYPSINTLAEGTSMSRDSIMRALRSLEECGLILIRKRMQDGVNLPNYYTLTFTDLRGVVAVGDHGSSCERLGVVAVGDSNLSVKPINKPIKKNNTKVDKKTETGYCPKEHLGEHGVDDQLFKDFMAGRKSKRAGELTKTAVDRIVKQAALAGWTVKDAITEAASRSWVSFDASWVNKPSTAKPNGKPSYDDGRKRDYGEGGLI